MSLHDFRTQTVKFVMRSVPVPGKYLDRVLSIAGVDLSQIELPQTSFDRWREFEINVDRFDTHIKKHIFFQGYFEWAETNFIRDFLKPGQTFVDVGANIGWHTLLAARSVGESGRVSAFEPVSSTFQELKSNIELNKLENVTLQKIGLSNATGSIVIFGNKENDSGGNTLFGGHDHIPLETIRTRRGDDVLPEQGIEHVDLLKADVEGAEMFVLGGLERYLAERRIKAMLLEVNDHHLRAAGTSPAELLAFVRSNGFLVADVRRPKQPISKIPEGIPVVNVVCWREA